MQKVKQRMQANTICLKQLYANLLYVIKKDSNFIHEDTYIRNKVSVILFVTKQIIIMVTDFYSTEQVFAWNLNHAGFHYFMGLNSGIHPPLASVRVCIVEHLWLCVFIVLCNIWVCSCEVKRKGCCFRSEPKNRKVFRSRATGSQEVLWFYKNMQ